MVKAEGLAIGHNYQLFNLDHNKYFLFLRTITSIDHGGQFKLQSQARNAHLLG